MRRRWIKLQVAGKAVAAGLFAFFLSGQTYFKQFTEVEPVCTGAAPRYGKEVDSGFPLDRIFEFAPGQPEYDRTIALLPDAIPGWAAASVRVTATASHTIGCNLNAARSLRRNDQTLAVAVTLGPVVDAMKLTLSGKAGRTSPKPFNYKGHIGIVIKSGPDESLMLIVGKVALMVAGPLTAAERRAVLDRLDLDAIMPFKP